MSPCQIYDKKHTDICIAYAASSAARHFTRPLLSMRQTDRLHCNGVYEKKKGKNRDRERDRETVLEKHSNRQEDREQKN